MCFSSWVKKKKTRFLTEFFAPIHAFIYLFFVCLFERQTYWQNNRDTEGSAIWLIPQMAEIMWVCQDESGARDFLCIFHVNAWASFWYFCRPLARNWIRNREAWTHGGHYTCSSTVLAPSVCTLYRYLVRYISKSFL